jgi:hypothetical protein
MIRNPFGGNAFGSGLVGPYPYSAPVSQPGYGQFGNAGGYFNGGIPFQGGNMFPAGSNGVVLPPRSFSPGPMNGPFVPGFGIPVAPGNGVVLPPRSFSPGPMNGPFVPGYGVPVAPGNGFMNQPIPFPSGPQQPPYFEPNQFGSGTFGRSRSRHGSRHRSKSRGRRSRSPSSSEDEYDPRGFPFTGPGVPYQNLQPFQNMPPRSPRAGSPVIPPRVPLW